jgi:hypothetical protein
MPIRTRKYGQFRYGGADDGMTAMWNGQFGRSVLRQQWLRYVILAMSFTCVGFCGATEREQSRGGDSGGLKVAQSGGGATPNIGRVPEKIRATTFDGVPLDEPIHIELRGVRLSVPAGCLWPWPTHSMRKRVNEGKELAFDFWMPDRRCPSVGPISYTGYRPLESGRHSVGPDAHIVKVRTLMPVTLSEQGYVSPDRAFQNRISLFGPSTFSFHEEPFGLVRFWQHDWPHPSPQPFTDYRHREGTDPQILLKCTPPHAKPPFPSCDGRVHFAKDNLGFFLHFSRDRLTEWQEIVTAVRDLFVSWRDIPK